MTRNSLLVFSHPNHEVAILIAIEDVKPTIVYLTDGGGEQRVSETREALSQLGALSRAIFLNYPESSFYDGILRGDADFFREVRSRVFDAVTQLDIDAIFCDAVEFYNPVHDIALPIVSGQLANVPVFEIPLIQEDAAIGVQMLATPPGVREETTLLTAAQVEKKLRFLSTIYSSLSRYLSVSLPTDDLRYADHEAFFEARANPVLPAPGAEIRYDLRGRILVERGIYDEAITFSGHYLPLVEALK